MITTFFVKHHVSFISHFVVDFFYWSGRRGFSRFIIWYVLRDDFRDLKLQQKIVVHERWQDEFTTGGLIYV